MKFYINTLGCKVNTYESNVMEELLIDAGFIKSDEDNCDIYIINTCSVTNQADNKSLKMIRHAIKDNVITIVCGCYSQRNVDIVKEMGVSIVLGNKYKADIVSLINEYLKDRKQIVKVENIMKTNFENMVLHDFDRTRAFVKIQDGCNNFCAYCAIPFNRGGVRSKDKDTTLKEINCLVEKGFREIVLVGIHTGNYGEEFENYKFKDLLNDIIKIDGLDRIRISSIEITELNEEVLDIIRRSDKIANHLHIPLQAGSNHILKGMNRKYDLDYYFNKIEEIRSIRSSIAITTDVIVGFPGETDEDFMDTLDTCRKVKFAKVHVFPYSRRSGTKADAMSNHIDDVTKKNRAHQLLELSKELEMDYFNKFIGSKITFIPEVYKDGYLLGHTSNYLSIKCLSDKEIRNEEVSVVIDSIDYPYCLAHIKD